MNTTTLNMTTLDGGVIIKKGGGGGNAPSAKPKWTGHADAEGLKAIGWTDEDIAYYQENGVNWNEEEDEWHKVTEDNKALYGVLTASNISTYKDRIVYLPKIDLNELMNSFEIFAYCHSLTAIPMLDTSNLTNLGGMFQNCHSLTTIPQLDTSKVMNMGGMFQNCHSLTTIPMLDTSNVKTPNKMFYNCYSLTTIPRLDTSSITTMYQMFYNCHSLTTIPMLDTNSVSDVGSAFYKCYSLTTANLKGVAGAYELNNSALLSKESLLYLINNEAATSAITIKLASYAYDKWATDPDIVAALANHPNISLAK